MSYGLFLSAAGMQANQYRMDIIANNLANAATTGFKRDLAVLSQRPVESRLQGGTAAAGAPVFEDMSGGLNVTPTFHDVSQGGLEQTGRALDVAVTGEGFLAVRDRDAVRYTRDGRLTFNQSGELVLVSGAGRLRVLSDEGTPIQRLEDGRGEVQVTDGGEVRQGTQVLGRIRLVAFDAPRQLRKIGHDLFDAGDAVPRGASGRIIARTLERSTVDPIASLTNMIEAQRAYEMNARALSVHDQMTGLAVNTVGRVG